MASDDLGLVQAQPCHDNGLNHPHLRFPSSFSPPPPPTQRGASGVDPVPKTSTCELTSGFVDHHLQGNYFLHNPTPVDFRRQTFSSAGPSSSDRDSHNWKTSCDASTSAGGSEDDDTGEDDEEDYDGDRCEEIEVQAPVPFANNAKNNDRNARINSIGDNNENVHTPGLKDGHVVRQTGNEDCNDETRNAVTMEDANGQIFCPQYVQGTRRLESDAAAPKSSMGFENGCGFSGRKDTVQSTVSGEKLRAILSDPLTDALMDDAMILPCGHSFGSGGIQHVLRMKACYTCSHPVSGNSVSPNLSLRAAVQAFCREEALLVNCASKRRRERYEQDKGTYVESVLSGHPRGRSLQFPFAVTDRVVIKGNKRTPPRFVGREAIVTTQCLNGWYVVKTLDNAESVKLQYRSLAKVPDNPVTNAYFK